MMRAEILDEPELEFASGTRHIDIRFGLMNAGPLDVLSARQRVISVGLVGSSESVEVLSRWLERCREVIPAKESPYVNMFPRFPGFQPEEAFRSTLLLESRAQRTIAPREFARIAKGPRSNETVKAMVELFIDEMRYVAEKARPDVLVCAPPMEVMEAVKDGGSEVTGDNTGHSGFAREPRYEFHDLLKARAMALKVPVQLVWPPTYDAGRLRRQKGRPERARELQDEATRAWNLHTALYYKAGGLPWRSVRDWSQFDTCSVGVSFYRSLDGEHIHTSMAQVFNEKGDGVVVRGGQVKLSKEDLQPHLDREDADALLGNALAIYRREHKNLPARIVLHKTSRYSVGEIEGFRAAAERAGVDDSDFLSLDESFIRFYRQGEQPPLRGTMLCPDSRTIILYTRGAVDFFRTYPGLYVPVPVLIRLEDSQKTQRFLALEILALTKMNWNSTQFDGRDPITVRAARQVGAILRYLEQSDPVEPHYSYYM